MLLSFKKKLKKDSSSMTNALSKAARHSTTDNKIIKKAFRASSGARYGLIIGDDGAILIYMIGKVVKSRNFIANATPDNLKEFEKVLEKDKTAPLYMIIDSMDQNFIQQSLPPISTLGVKKLIKRRLDRDLGADAIKGYVLLERDKDGRRDWNFLMVSLENSPNLNLWFDFAERIDNRLVGIYLLSVETENIIKNIDFAIGVPKKTKTSSPDSRWKFFVTHNKVGGFRQVVLRDERIIFTRLTQPVGDMTADVIAGNIEQEMRSTIEYIKRLSFNPQQGLDIYIIASAEINESLDLSAMPARKVQKFTPFEISSLLGITGAAQATDQFGDVVLTSCIASSKFHRLRLTVPKAEKVNNLYNLINYERTATGIMVLVMLGYGGVNGLELMQKYSEIENLGQKKSIQQRRLEQIDAEVKKSGIDVKKISDTIALYKQVTDESRSPLSLLARLRAAIIGSVVVREIVWDGGNVAVPPAPDGTKEESVSLVLLFPEISNTDEAFSSVARKVLKDVRAAFPEYKAVYTKLPDILFKKLEGGEIKFDDKDEVTEIDKASLEATMLLTRQSGIQPPSSVIGSGSAGQQQISTDKAIGLEK